jgi:uncharacterized protein DUF2252
MRQAMRVRLAALAALGLLPLQGAAADSLGVDPTDPRFVGRGDLVLKLRSSVHDYFRFVNAGFAAETCSLFADVVDQMPEVNLHGDAHIEQYTVTNLGRGLSDFDDCTRGKAVIDLVRLGASILIAARERDWTHEEDRFISEFLKGYRDGLKGERMEMPTPDLVTRIRASFTWDHAGALRQANALIDRAPRPNDSFDDGVARFVELVGKGHVLGKDAFKVKRIGMLTMGIGSALDEKYLILFEGKTPSDEDDMVVEAKQIRDLQRNPCVRTDVGASRVLDGALLIAYEPFAYAAVVPHGDKHFWMHDWTDDYQETSIATMLRTPKDLRQIAFDAGVQMGRAHPKRPDGGPDKDRRKASLKSLDALERRVRIAMKEMAGRTDVAWRAFARSLSTQTPTGER